MALKINTYLKNARLNINLLGSVIFLCVGSSAQSEDSSPDYSYIDCNILGRAVNAGIDVIEYTTSHRLDNKNKDFAAYSEKLNKYTDSCDVSCVVNEDSIVWKKNVKFEDKNVTFTYTINRWNGNFEGSSSIVKDGKLKYQAEYSGKCQSGVSKLKTEPKF